ncbi:MAG TPA: TIR domain-containing protein [Pseudonocardiaceae bacterium]|nr:TIR domain-containing protein [Pseudonocardiaceae bacterium]
MRGVTPARLAVSPGTLLWRVHDHAERADDLTGPVYVSELGVTGLAERLLSGPRPARQVADMVLSPVRTTVELVVLRLLNRQDVVSAGLPELDLAELPGSWPPWLHDRMPDVAGVVWPARHDLPNPTMVLFGDRCPAGALQVESDSGIRLDTRAGVNHVNRELARHGVAIPLPDRTLVFINYRSGDDRLVVDLLDKELCARFGRSAVFRDDRSLGAGVLFGAELIRKVRACAVLITVVGPRWEESYDHTGQRLLDRENDWVRREIEEAMGHGVHVVPVLVGARAQPGVNTLPDTISTLFDHQFLHLPRGYTPEHVRQLVDRLISEVPELDDWTDR